MVKQSVNKFIDTHKRDKLYKSARNINSYHHNIIDDKSDYHEKFEGKGPGSNNGSLFGKMITKIKNFFKPQNHKNQVLKGSLY